MASLFCSKNILTKLVGYHQPICLCVKMELVVGTISLSCELFFSGAVFVHVRSAQLCTENSVSFHMRSAAEVAWLAQNILHSNTRMWLVGFPSE